MDADVIRNILSLSVTRTRQLMSEVKQIRSKKNLSDDDLQRLAELKLELFAICPPLRYAWRDGIPAIDIWSQIIEIERSPR